MADLMPIGRFARLTGLSAKALRLYDECGLLSPAVIDITTGYRYYSREQVPLARRIQLLRALAMPLADIRTLLETPDAGAARAQLAGHRQGLEQRIADYQRALTNLQGLDRWYQQQGQEPTMEAQSQPYACSFCGKPNAEVGRLIAGPKGVFICNECVDLCNKILDPDEPPRAGDEGRATAQGPMA